MAILNGLAGKGREFVLLSASTDPTDDASGDDIGRQLIFDGVNAVLEKELFLFQPFDQKLVGRSRLFQLGDLFVQGAMALLQRNKLVAQFLFLFDVHCLFVPPIPSRAPTIVPFRRIRKLGRLSVVPMGGRASWRACNPAVDPCISQVTADSPVACRSMMLTSC